MRKTVSYGEIMCLIDTPKKLILARWPIIFKKSWLRETCLFMLWVAKHCSRGKSGWSLVLSSTVRRSRWWVNMPTRLVGSETNSLRSHHLHFLGACHCIRSKRAYHRRPSLAFAPSPRILRAQQMLIPPPWLLYCRELILPWSLHSRFLDRKLANITWPDWNKHQGACSDWAAGRAVPSNLVDKRLLSCSSLPWESNIRTRKSKELTEGEVDWFLTSINLTSVSASIHLESQAETQQEKD